MIKRFFSYIEIKTKITTSIPFLLAIAYLLYVEQPIDWKLSLIFFASMMLCDFATTATNNYIDTKTNNQSLQFDRKTALAIILALYTASAMLGLYLAYLTDIIVLLLGILCFICGVLYTYGPVPISRLPLGEIMSGVFQGLIGPFIMLYVNMPQGFYISLDFSLESIDFSFKLLPLVTVLLLTIAPMCTVANIMLANNICDLERDIEADRFTLAYYFRKKALYVFAALYYLCYLSILVMVIVKILSPILLLSLCTLIPVQRNINSFFKKQEKGETFILSIKNFLLIMGSYVILLFISSITG